MSSAENVVMAEQHGMYPMKPNFICTQCKEGFHNLGSLAIHMETHEVPFTKTMRGHDPDQPKTVVPVDIGNVGACEVCRTPLPMMPGSAWPQTCSECKSVDPFTRTQRRDAHREAKLAENKLETHDAMRHVDGTSSSRTVVPPDVGKVGVCEMCWAPLPMRPGSVWPQKCEACRDKKKRVVYISGPYTGTSPNEEYENIQRARTVAIKYWRLGYAVICPHTNGAFMNGGPDDYEMFIDGDLEFVRRSDIIVMLPRWADSKGALQELAEARRCGKEVIWES